MENKNLNTLEKDQNAKIIKLIIIDEQPLVRQGIFSILSKDPLIQVIGEACNGQEALDLIASVGIPHLILTEVNMPGMDGIELMGELLHNLKLDIKVVAFTSEEEEWNILKMLSSGASGYILKSEGAQILIKAIRAVVEYDSKYCSKSIDSKIIQRAIGVLQMEEKYREQINSLSKLDLKIIRLMCKEKSTKEIAAELKIRSNTVDTTRSRIYTKLSVRNPAGVVKWALRSGFYQEE
jgi:DNA-binding NarL/FixJ family response regulator